MTDNSPSRRRVPLWVNVLIVLCMLPALAFPQMLSMTVAGSPVRTFVWLYPLYVLASGWFARICYPQRADLTWVLLAVLLLAHAAMWMLVLGIGMQ